MKKLLLLFGLTSFILGNTLAQENKEADNTKPVIKFEKAEYDFGTIKQGGNGTFQLIFTNEGKEPLVVSNVGKSCGCTSTDWIKEPVKKGKKGWVKVTYNTQLVGPFLKSISVYSNASIPALEIKFKGVVEPAQASTAASDNTK